MATNNAANNATAASGTVLQGAGVGTASTYSTATYPSTATGTGTILRADGTNWSATTSTYPNTNAINTLLYASSANVMSALTTANSGVLATSSSGVPSIDTTNFAVLSTGLQLKGNNTNTAPPAGFIGEQIRSTVAAEGNSISNNTVTNLTSINLTAGIWDVSLVMVFAGMTTGTAVRASISTTSATEGTFGDNKVCMVAVGQSTQDQTLVVPAYRLTLSTTTTVYAVGFALYSAGTGTFYGRISGTRVG